MREVVWKLICQSIGGDIFLFVENEEENPLAGDHNGVQNWRFRSPGELEKDKTHLMEFVPGFRSYLLRWVSGLSIPIISPHPLNQKVTTPLDTSHPHNANLSKYFYTYSRHWEPGG